MAGRKNFDAAAKRHFSAAAVRGLSRRQYARAQGVDGRSLHVWHLNLSRQVAAPSAVDFIEFVAASRTTPERSPLLVRRQEFVIEVPAARAYVTAWSPPP